MLIDSVDALRDLYAQPKGRAAQKQLPKLEKHSKNFIELAPFVVISTANHEGKLDTSPRGGEPGFVKVISDTCIVIPDSKGNNRIDSLINIVDSGRIGTLFMIPGVDETLRVNGRAQIKTDPEILTRFSYINRPPVSYIEITIEEVFLHCAKSLMRSKLWDSSQYVERSRLPTMGQMISDQIGDSSPPETQDQMLKRYQGDL